MNKAFIFDMNGTLIDDMSFHLDVWFDFLNKDLGANLPYEVVKSHLYGKNEEVIERIFGKGRYTLAEMAEFSIEKERRYQEVYRPHLKLIAGLENLLNEAHQKSVPMAIGTAGIPFNVHFVVDNLNLSQYFKAVVTADDVTHSKPHPETFLLAAKALNYAPENCIVFEDSPKGVETALNAGMQCVVIKTVHNEEEFSDYSNIIKFVDDYTQLSWNDLK